MSYRTFYKDAYCEEFGRMMALHGIKAFLEDPSHFFSKWDNMVACYVSLTPTQLAVSGKHWQFSKKSSRTRAYTKKQELLAQASTKKTLANMRKIIKLVVDGKVTL